jgi:S-adenosylmethionine-diacylglycerol 3-amino-3-carboxypropyl transferase
MIHAASAKEKLRTRLFRAVHGRNLVYNTCWEDPALDRVALDFQPSDRVLVITSAGCNALDYLLAGAGEVQAVDVNPIQNALLELKCAAIRALDYPAFFSLFGRGHSPQAREMYFDAVRRYLPAAARAYWDRRIRFFQGRGWRKSFYYRGTAGSLARILVMHAHLMHGLRRPIEQLLEAQTLDEQRQVYESKIRARLWTPWLHWFLSRSSTLSLFGVPWTQRDQILSQYAGNVGQYIRNAVEELFTQVPIATNYFWRVYLQGCYTPKCCPEYLKADNFARLKGGLLDRLRIATGSLTEFLRGDERGFSKFTLLDHMDWMSGTNPEGLADEWTQILARARSGSRVIFRSAARQVTYLDHLRIRRGRREAELHHLLRYHPELAATLHTRDRVHTYGNFYIADLLDSGEA